MYIALTPCTKIPDRIGLAKHGNCLNIITFACYIATSRCASLSFHIVNLQPVQLSTNVSICFKRIYTISKLARIKQTTGPLPCPHRIILVTIQHIDRRHFFYPSDGCKPPIRVLTLPNNILFALIVSAALSHEAELEQCFAD